MWRNAVVSVACAVALLLPFEPRPAAADEQAATTISCNSTADTPDPTGLGTWVGTRLGGDVGRGVTRWLVGADRAAESPPRPSVPRCGKARELDLVEVAPGLGVSQRGETVTVVADRRAVVLRADTGLLRRAVDLEGDVVVNANWFTAAGPYGPVVADGSLAGSPDTPERGQLLARRPGCGPDGPASELQHLWTGEQYLHDPCVVTAVSGVSLVHKGVRADAYPGYDITTGRTNTSTAHSFIGFNQTEIIAVATREMTASQLADYAISLGVNEGLLLDGGGSTQIATPVASLHSERAVPTFAVLEATGFDEVVPDRAVSGSR